MKRFILLVSILFLAEMAYSQKASIQGQIKNSEGVAVDYATIRLKKENKSFTTDANGKFSITGLTEGVYTLVISAVGFETKEENIALTGSETKQAEIVLTAGKFSFMNEVVITSRKKEQLKEDFTSAVTVVNTATIQQLQSVNNNASDILAATVPGLGMSSGTSSNWGQTLRGRQVLILVDGVSQSTPLRNGSVDMRTIDANVVERIEVIKGANSIYGNGAAGGIINYITNNNLNINRLLTAKTELASTGSVINPRGTLGGRISQSFSGKLNQFDYTVSGTYEQTGKVKDAAGDIVGPTYGLSNNKIYNTFAKLGYRLNDNQRIQLSYNFFKSLEETNLAEVMGSRKDGRKTMAVEGITPGSAPGTRWNHNGLLKYSNDRLIGQTSLNVNAYIQDINTLFFYSTQFENGGQSTIQSSKKGLRFDFNSPLAFSKNFSADVTYGVDILKDVTSQPLLDGRTWVPKMDMVSKAPFMQLEASILQDVVINGGLRYENITIGVDDYTTLKPYNAQTQTFGTSVNVKGGQIDYNNLVFNTGLRFKKYDFFKPYVNFSQGFSVADLGLLLRAARVNDIAKIQTEPVIINNYEAGFASEFKAFRFEASAYISKSKLGSSFIEQNGFYVIARQPERVHGFELAADLYLDKSVMVGTSYSYVEGKRDGNGNDKYGDPQDTYLGGERITPSKFTAYVSYTPTSKWNLRADLLASGKRERFQPNANGVYKTYEGKVDAYQLVNFASSYKLSKATQLKLGVENLLNADYFPSRSLWPSIDQYYIKGRGLSFTLGLSAQF